MQKRDTLLMTNLGNGNQCKMDVDGVEKKYLIVEAKAWQ